MGKTSDDSSTIDRSRSWARSLAWNKHASAKKQATILPTSEPVESRVATDAHAVTHVSSNSSTTARQVTQENSNEDDAAFKNNIVVDDDPAPSKPTVPRGPEQSKVAGEKSSTLDGTVEPDKPPKLPWPVRTRAGIKRFGTHTKDALTHSWINVLLVFVPIGIAAKAANLGPVVVFAMNAVAIVPLAGMLAFATESVASRLGDTLGALLNVSFGNAVELIIFIALVKDEIRVVQAALLGSILANLLLILGMAFALGGLRYREQIYNSTVTQMSACLLSLSVMSLLLPTAFHASFSDSVAADYYTLKISRGTSVILLLVYVLFLVFQLKSHAYLYSSMPQERIDEESHPGVLHDLLDSSTSSDSSDSSSSSDGSDTSGSQTTAKKIKRFIRNRRKSSTSSHETPTLSAFPSPGNTSAYELNSHPVFFDEGVGSTRQGSITLPDVLSGDEGDTEGARERRHEAGLPKARDMQDAHNAEASGRSADRKQKREMRKQRKRERREAKKQKKRNKTAAVSVDESAHAVTEKPPNGHLLDASRYRPGLRGSPQVGFSEEVESREGMVTLKKSPLMPFARPGLPKLLSQNVFVDPQPTCSPNLGQERTASRSGTSHALRRTSSLPDRIEGHRSGGQAGGRILPQFVARSVVVSQARHASDPTGGAVDDEDAEEKEAHMSRTAAVMMLLISTGLVALCAEFLVDAIPEMTNKSSVSQAFIGLIILPIVGNAAEHVTAVTVAAKNKMDLAIGVAVGSSIQIALFVTPLVVILGWCMNKGMSLYFNLFETVSLFATAFVVNFLVLDGRSNYLEGTLLIAAYVIIAVAAFYYPDEGDESDLGGADSAGKDMPTSTTTVAVAVATAAVRMLMG